MRERLGEPRTVSGIHVLVVSFLLVASTVTRWARGGEESDGPRTLVLHWTAPSGCPDEEAMRAWVAGLVGANAALDAEGALTGEGGQYRVLLRVKSGASLGERELAGDECAQLAHSAAVVLALSATSKGEDKPPPPPPPPSPIPPPPDVVPSFRTAKQPPAAPKREPVGHVSHFRIAPVGSLDVGTLPATAFGGGADVSISPGRGVLFGVSGTVWGNDRGGLSSLEGQGARFSLLTADANGCYGFTLRPFELSPCVIFEFAHLSASGFGALHPTPTVNTDWFAVGLGGRARWELNAYFAVALELAGLAPTRGESFYIASGGTVHAVSPVTFRTSFGPELRF